jgi:hypothetical protein
MKEASSFRERGNAQFSLGDYSAAVAAYVAGIRALQTCRATERSEGAFRRSLAVLHSNKSACELHLGKPLAAERDATVAIAADCTYAKAFYRRAAARRALGRLAGAAADLARLLEAPPPSPAGLHMGGLVELAAQREAVEAARSEAAAAFPVQRAHDGGVRGHHLRATRDIQKGEVVLRVWPLAAILDDARTGTHCCRCFSSVCVEGALPAATGALSPPGSHSAPAAPAGVGRAPPPILCTCSAHTFCAACTAAAARASLPPAATAAQAHDETGCAQDFAVLATECEILRCYGRVRPPSTSFRMLVRLLLSPMQRPPSSQAAFWADELQDAIALSSHRHTPGRFSGVLAEDYSSLAARFAQFCADRAFPSLLPGLPSRGELEHILFMLPTNWHALMPPGNDAASVGRALVPSACYFNHSCDPAVDWRWDSEGFLVYEALRPIPLNQEVTASYVALDQAVTARNQFLQRYFCFRCSCARCEAERSEHDGQVGGS